MYKHNKKENVKTITNKIISGKKLLINKEKSKLSPALAKPRNIVRRAKLKRIKKNLLKVLVVV